MFGKNPVAKERLDDFLVKEIFYTIQGEGPFSGHPALFVRLAGCNLRCYFCDTDFSGGEVELAVNLAARIDQLISAHRCKLVVLTGGEPMLQPLPHLFLWFLQHDIHFQIETAGTVWPLGLDTFMAHHPSMVSIVCSPKTPKLAPEVEERVTAWKYIIRAGETSKLDGLPIFPTQSSGELVRGFQIFRPKNLLQIKDRIYVQPCDDAWDKTGKNVFDPARVHNGQGNVEEAARVAMKYGYRLSLQVHKIAGLP